MSGGSTDYVFSRIYGAAQQVKDYRREVAARPTDDFEFDAKRTTMSPEELRTKVLQHLDNGIVKLLEAEVYARRVEWLSSGDDGFDSFVERTDEDLAEVQKSLDVTLESPKPYVVNEMRDLLIQFMDAMESRGYNPNETVDDGDPMYKAWNRARELLGKDNANTKG